MYQGKECRMVVYLTEVRKMLSSFKKFEIKQILRSQNANADSLARLTIAYDVELDRMVPVEVLNSPNILREELMEIKDPTEVETHNLMTPIIKYLEGGELSNNKTEAWRLRCKADHYVISNGRLYKRGYSLPLLKSIDLDKADYIMWEIHEGICGNHSGPWSLAKKIIQQGYYWPSLGGDAHKYIASCDRCQRFANVPKQPPDPITNIMSPWSFVQWGLT